MRERVEVKILWVLDSPFYPVHGGSARVVYHQAALLVKRGVDAYAICRNKELNTNQTEEIEGIKTNIYGAKASGKILSFIKSVQNGKKSISKILSSNSPFDFALLNQPLSAFAVRKSLHRYKIPSIYFYHSPFSSEYSIRYPSGILMSKLQSNLLNYIEKKCFKSAQIILFASKYMEQQALKIHPVLEEYPRKVIPLGVDLARFECKKDVKLIREKLKLWPEIPTALTVRNLEPRMGLENLICAWAIVVKECPDALLLIGGEGSLENRLNKLIKEYDLEKNVNLLGYISEGKLPQYYQAADFFVLPTIELEGFGLVTVESLACGTPVLGTHVGAIPEVLNPLDPTLIFHSRKAVVMAERLIKFIKQKEHLNFSPEKCRRYVEENYSWEIHVDRLLQVISELKRNREKI